MRIGWLAILPNLATTAFLVSTSSGCSASPSPASSVDAGGSDGATIGSNDGGSPDDGGAGGPTYTVQFGPIDVPPYTERTQCIVTRLGNAAPIHVGRIHDVLGNASHHMIVYKVNETTEQTTPFDCRPFQEALNPQNGNPLLISQKKDDLLELPPGVAFTLDANQMIRLEMHYINPTADTVTLQSTSTMETLTDPNPQEASFLFIGDTDFELPPMATYTLGPKYFPVPATYASSNFFAITGHEHQWGTNVQVWTASSGSDPGTAVYQVPGWTWSEPKTVTFDPPFQLPAAGGFKFQCDWYNGSTDPVPFGESATQEMCFFWAYYYPGNGAAVCFHSDTDAGAYDECCPGNAQLCARLNQQDGDGGP